MGEIPLLEPSFVDAITGIESAGDLSERQRRHWVCSLRQVAKWLDRPSATIPARLTSIKAMLAQVHHARVGVTAKTVANHRANVRAALRWFGKEHHVPPRGVPLSLDWVRLLNGIEDRHRRYLLYGLMRYCSGRAIHPDDVDDAIFGVYMRYRGETSAMAVDDQARRRVAKTWNSCIGLVEGWPANRLTEPPLKAKARPAWEDFPEGLCEGIEAYLSGLQKPHRGAGGRRIRACRPLTIQTRRAKLVAVARKAVEVGVPIESITSLAALLAPDIVERVIEGYWKKNGQEPKLFTIQLGGVLLRVARAIGCLDAKAIERLDEIRATLEDHRGGALTKKNMDLIRLVLTDGIWSEVVALPKLLMQEARSLTDHAPIKAAVTAQIAVAIAILTFAPVRLNNLDRIEIGQNLIKPGGANSPYWLVFERYDVKNRVDLNFDFDEDVTALIDEFVHEFRPVLLRGTNAPWLFPGRAGKPKCARDFSYQITRRISKAIGLRITVHQFRHAAAAIYLKHHPGEYETVRRVLGHTSLQATINFYCGLQTIDATRQFAAVVRKQLKFTPEDA
jgi:site-specific recombinase XerD